MHKRFSIKTISKFLIRNFCSLRQWADIFKLQKKRTKTKNTVNPEKAEKINDQMIEKNIHWQNCP